jgi:sugar phosphate isomerase/epimerase
VSPSTPPFAVCEFTTLRSSFEEDLAAYGAAGVSGIGICEIKLEEGREEEQLEALTSSGLESRSAVPAVPSILPLPLFPGPEDPDERVEALCASVRRLAPFEPCALVCLTGPAGELGDRDARRIVVEGLRAVADEAERAGFPVGLEPMSAHFREDWTIVTMLGEAAELSDEVGHENLGILFDTWHLWDTPDVLAEIGRHGDRIVGVHVNGWREETRSWCDRVLPGDGVADLPPILGALAGAGWRGAYELEVFSDDGTFGSAYPDSLWMEDAGELARRGHDAFRQLWEQAAVQMKT